MRRLALVISALVVGAILVGGGVILHREWSAAAATPVAAAPSTTRTRLPDRATPTTTTTITKPATTTITMSATTTTTGALGKLPPGVPDLSIPILVYHYVDASPPPAGPYAAGLTVRTQDFEAEMALLERGGYHTVTFDQLWRAMARQTPLPSKPVLLTFDDGGRDNYTVAFPILKRHGLVATFFVITDSVGTNPQSMTWAQLREMRAAGMVIGSHTRGHPDLRTVSPDPSLGRTPGVAIDHRGPTGCCARRVGIPGGQVLGQDRPACPKGRLPHGRHHAVGKDHPSRPHARASPDARPLARVGRHVQARAGIRGVVSERATHLDDLVWAIVGAQLGRPARGVAGVAARCPHGYPAAVETRPYLEDGTPFPTLFYLTCPSAAVRAGDWEARGGVAELRRVADEDPALGAALAWLEHWYRERRRGLAGDSWVGAVDGGAALGAGIGGPVGVGRATCLHAYAAALLAVEAQESDVPVGHRQAWQGLLVRYGDLWCDDAACQRLNGTADRRAALDVGTNTVRLLVADVVDRRPIAVTRRAVVTRLGQDLGTSGVLHVDAMARTTREIEDFVADARRLGASAITLVGTSATRDAADGRAFIGRLGHRLGICALVVPGEVEARLTYAGATLDVSGEVVLLDVGGGSTELVAAGPDGSLFARSLDVGSVRATERWVQSDPPTPAELASVRDEVSTAVQAFVGDYTRGETARRLVGVAGTVVTMACLALGLDQYRSEDVHLQCITREQVAVQVARLAALTNLERTALPCMQPGREGVVCAGGAIVLAVMDTLGYDELIVSERDILDGIILASGELACGALGP